jgi:hypothetical protein
MKTNEATGKYRSYPVGEMILVGGKGGVKSYLLKESSVFRSWQQAVV